jgi:hypothetical protein
VVRSSGRREEEGEGTEGQTGLKNSLCIYENSTMKSTKNCFKKRGGGGGRVKKLQ